MKKKVRKVRKTATPGLSAKFLVVLPERERRLVLELVKNNYHRTHSMLAAGYAKTTSHKQQARVCERPRVQQALFAIEYELKGSDWLSNEELNLIGVSARSIRQRERRKMEQVQLAVKLKINQSGISKLEKQTDMYVSTLRRLIKALGGELKISAVFPDGEVGINQFKNAGRLQKKEHSQRHYAAAR